MQRASFGTFSRLMSNVSTSSNNTSRPPLVGRYTSWETLSEEAKEQFNVNQAERLRFEQQSRLEQEKELFVRQVNQQHQKEKDFWLPKVTAMAIIGGTWGFLILRKRANEQGFGWSG